MRATFILILKNCLKFYAISRIRFEGPWCGRFDDKPEARHILLITMFSRKGPCLQIPFEKHLCIKFWLVNKIGMSTFLGGSKSGCGPFPSETKNQNY